GESVHAEAQVGMVAAGPVQRWQCGWRYDCSVRVAALRTQGKKPGAWLKLLNLFSNAVATRPLREQLGLSRLKRCYTGGASLGPDVFRFFPAIGVNLKQTYGQTANTGIGAVNHHDSG